MGGQATKFSFCLDCRKASIPDELAMNIEDMPPEESSQEFGYLNEEDIERIREACERHSHDLEWRQSVVGARAFSILPTSYDRSKSQRNHSICDSSWDWEDSKQLQYHCVKTSIEKLKSTGNKLQGT